MRSNVIIFVSLVYLVCNIHAQDRMIPADSMVITKHSANINGQNISYTAHCGTQPVWDKNGKVIATLFHTYYTRDNVADRANRPLVISFNGGPGSASVWMHMAYTGPKLLNIDDEGYPVQPYITRDNPYSILDVADIVFVNPVNTGYSRILDKEAKRDQFFGVNEDIKYLAEWINTFVTRHERWPSPKYLIGESYGTTRCSGLALELQNRQWMYLNGVILVSPTGLGIDRGTSTRKALQLPYFAATAWHHNALNDQLQARDLEDLLAEVEAYTMSTVLPAIHKGSQLTSEEKNTIAQQMSLYSGLDKRVILDYNLMVPTSFYWKELLRDKEKTIGRLDSRYMGVDQMNGGSRYDFDPSINSWMHSFTPAINHYLRKDLGFKTDIKYNMFGSVYPWNRDGDNTGMDLREAMGQNPYLHVLVQSGYYDGGTDYFNAKYNLWHMDPSGKVTDRMSFKGYKSGHMMYLRAEDLKAANDDIRAFIELSTPGKGVPAKY